jgi:hypothetical protein
VTVADAGVRYRPGATGADPARDAQVQAAIALLLDQPLSGQSAGRGLASPAPATSPSPPTQ